MRTFCLSTFIFDSYLFYFPYSILMLPAFVSTLHFYKPFLQQQLKDLTIIIATTSLCN
jgi:hypothetical protein